MVIDCRSDTVTRPCSEMRKVMSEAVVGDDVMLDDPTVKQLEDKVARMLGKEDALFVPSGEPLQSFTVIQSHSVAPD